MAVGCRADSGSSIKITEPGERNRLPSKASKYGDFFDAFRRGVDRKPTVSAFVNPFVLGLVKFNPTFEHTLQAAAGITESIVISPSLQRALQSQHKIDISSIETENLVLQCRPQNELTE